MSDLLGRVVSVRLLRGAWFEGHSSASARAPSMRYAMPWSLGRCCGTVSHCRPDPAVIFIRRRRFYFVAGRVRIDQDFPDGGGAGGGAPVRRDKAPGAAVRETNSASPQQQ